MEITKDTKIGDLIPEGYELSNDSVDGGITIYYKNKHPKTFEEYKRDFSYLYFIGSEYKEFQFNMGLLKYICQDLGISNERMFIFIYKCITEQPLTDEFAILRDILPDNFIDELVV